MTSLANRYLVTWEGEDDGSIGGTDVGELDIFGLGIGPHGEPVGETTDQHAEWSQ